MKRRSEHDELWSDLLSENAPAAFREASLDRTLAAVRRHQRRRRLCGLAAITAAPCFLLLGVILWQAHETLRSTASSGPIAQATGVVPGTHIQVITDEELFAMFPDRPAALLGSANDRHFVLLDEVPKPTPRASPATMTQSL